MGPTLSRGARIWLWVVLVLGAASTFDGVSRIGELSGEDQFYLALFALAVVLADVYRIRLPPYNIEITLSMGVQFGAALLFGTPAVALAVATYAADAILGKHRSRSLFNAAVTSLEIYWSARVFLYLHGGPIRGALLAEPLSAPAWGTAGAVFLGANLLCVLVIVALADRSGVVNVLRSTTSGIFVQLLTLPTLGVLVADLYMQHPASLLIVALPLVAVYYSLRSVEQIRKQTLATIERLTDLLDKRDPATDQHSRRVTEYVRLICRQLRLPADVTEVTAAAARVHDLGKIGVPDSVLFKPGQLDPDEWEQMKRHPAQGAEILQPMEAYLPSAEIILHHHERWDGRGYPRGLREDSIPLGSRIIAVADAYDVMRSDRPYTRALQHDTAMAELELQADKQFDPTVVEAFRAAMDGTSEQRTSDAPVVQPATPRQ